MQNQSTRITGLAPDTKPQRPRADTLTPYASRFDTVMSYADMAVGMLDVGRRPKIDTTACRFFVF